MSDQLHRIHPMQEHRERETIDRLVDDGVLVPVEPAGTFTVTRRQDYVAGIPVTAGCYALVRLNDDGVPE